MNMRPLSTCTIMLVLVMTLLASAGAHAGRSCEERKPTPQTIEKGLTFAAQTMAALDASGSKVVFLARAGQDLTKYGLRYSHLGIAYRQSDGKSGHVWRILHKLNQCGSSTSAIYRQGLGEFFLDDPWRYEAAFVVPARDVQEQLMALLQNDEFSLRMNHRPYSVVSYVWSTRYQQSNQWTIETLAMAMSASPVATTRSQSQAWLQSHGYQPTVLSIGPLARLGGRLTAANIAFDDHPPEKRYTDRIETVTVDSVFSWLERSGLGGGPVSIRLRGGP